jgi:hypothetical protein
VQHGLLPAKTAYHAVVSDCRYCTVSVSGIECVDDPLLPLMVRLNMPVLALRLALIVSLEVAPPVVAVTGLVPKLALTPRDRPLTLKLTELEALIAVTVTVVEPFEPRFIVNEVGEAARLKSGALPPPPAPTVNEAIAVLQL